MGFQDIKSRYVKGMAGLKTHLDYHWHPFPKGIFSLSKPLCQAINLYSLQQFKIHMAIEKRRSERASYKSSIIFFHAKHLINHNGNRAKMHIEELANLICQTIRATDVVTIYKNHTILVLLIDTGSHGAQCACKRIMKRIMDRYSPPLINGDDFHIKILSFPEKRIQSSVLEKLEPANAGSGQTRRSSDAHIASHLVFKKDYLENLNLCISSLNGSVISMPITEVFFWDQDLVSKYLLLAKKVIKRVIDFIGALVAILLLHPLMLFIAISIKLTSRGPVLFKQMRVGYKGKPFLFIKFRSMTVDNQESIHQDYVRDLIKGKIEKINMGTRVNPYFKIRNDPRITRLGRILRKTSLDELPQFFNVLKGEMSLVGPRPPIPYEVNEYKKWHYRRVFNVKPGITGLWQVSGRNRTTFDEMVRLDIQYAENWSLKMDLMILLKTITVIFAADAE